MTETENAVFIDSKGKRWLIALTVASIRKVKQILHIDLLNMQGDTMSRLWSSPLDLADCLYLVCESEARAAEISDEEFGERLTGDVIEHAAAALIDAIIFFSPKHLREPMRVTVQKVDQLQQKQAAAAIAWLNSEATGAELEKLVRTPGELSQNLQESLESTPGR